MLEHVSPNIALFLPLQKTQTRQGKPRQVKSCLGVLKLKSKQVQRLGLRPRSQRPSPTGEMRIFACVPMSPTRVQKLNLVALTGVKVSHSTQSATGA